MRFRRCARRSPRRWATTDARPSAAITSVAGSRAARPSRSTASTPTARPPPRLRHARASGTAGRPRARLLAADLRAGEARAVEELHREAVLGEQDRRGGAPGPRADDDDVSGPGRHAVTATSLP